MTPCASLVSRVYYSDEEMSREQTKEVNMLKVGATVLYTWGIPGASKAVYGTVLRQGKDGKSYFVRFEDYVGCASRDKWAFDYKLKEVEGTAAENQTHHDLAPWPRWA